MKIRHLLGAICAGPLVTTVAHASPQLFADKWVEITPRQITTGSNDTCIMTGIAIDPQNPSTLYVGNGPFNADQGGLYKSEDGGSNWTRVAKITPAFSGASDHIDQPVHVRIDPNDSKHLYVGDAVRGTSFGFFVSHDAGESFEQPQGFKDILKDAAIAIPDIYDVAVDPSNFDHILLSFHYPWGDGTTKYNNSAGILESRDGGTKWIVHDPVPGVSGAGQSIKFLFSPDLTVGNSNTWLFGAQEGGYWRTADAGKTWAQVSKTNITHGGSDIYYSKSGWLYTSGSETTLRSNVSNNGVTWEPIGPSTSSTVGGDGDRLWTGKSFGGNSAMLISDDKDGATWKDFNSQVFVDGPFAYAYDQYYGILYSSNWSSGVWALKANAGSGKIPPLTEPKPLPPVDPSTGGSASGASGSASSGTGSGSGNATSGASNSGGSTSVGTSSGSPSAGTPSGIAGSSTSNLVDMPSNAPSSGGCAACRVVGSSPSNWTAITSSLAALALLRLRRRRAA